MNKFTFFVDESRKNYDSLSLLQSEITSYINKVKKVVPKKVQDAIYITQKYNILDSQSLLDIKNAKKTQLKDIAAQYDMPESSIIDLWTLLNTIKKDIKMMPQFMSASQRKAIEDGKMAVNDLTIDLKSSEGRNAAAKMYMPLVMSIVNQYVGKSSLNKSDLMSVALEGFTDAMNDWDGEGGTSFKTYAGFRVKQSILNEINSHGGILSGGNSYNTDKYGSSLFQAISIDGLKSGDDDIEQDQFKSLGVDDKSYRMTRNEEISWKELFELIENKFDQRRINTFYRFFGLNGYKKEKSKDIAKELGKSEAYIRNNQINPILSFLKKDRRAVNVIQDLQDIYSESLMIDLIGCDRNMVLETLLNDDVYILLEELNKWSNKDVFKYSLNNAQKDLDDKSQSIINDILSSDFEYLDDNFKKYKKIIILFLNGMYPTENMSRKSDVDILEYMQELQEYYKLYKL